MSKNRWRLSDGGICSTTTKARAECAGGISIPLRVKRWNNTRLIYTLGRRRRRRRMQRRIYIIRVSFLFLKKKKRRRVKKKPWGHVRGARTIFKLVYNRNLAITACIWTWSVVVHVRTLLLLLYNRKKRGERRARTTIHHGTGSSLFFIFLLHSFARAIILAASPAALLSSSSNCLQRALSSAALTSSRVVPDNSRRVYITTRRQLSTALDVFRRQNKFNCLFNYSVFLSRIKFLPFFIWLIGRKTSVYGRSLIVNFQTISSSPPPPLPPLRCLNVTRRIYLSFAKDVSEKLTTMWILSKKRRRRRHLLLWILVGRFDRDANGNQKEEKGSSTHNVCARLWYINGSKEEAEDE